MTLSTSADPLEILVVADEVDEYSSALPGLQLDVVRTGEGYGPNIARSVVFDDVAIGSGVVQFPVLGRTDIGDTDVVFGLVNSAPPGSRWCEIDVRPGTLLIYGPGSEHAAVSPAGIGYSFTLVDVRALEEHADEVELPIHSPERGEIRALAPSQRTKPLLRLLGSLRDPLAPAALRRVTRRDALHAAAAALGDNSLRRRVGQGRRLDSRRLVSVCVEYADGIGRTPSLPELCLVAHVSERRLRTAFTDTVNLPPIRYFRYRLLNQARQRLLDSARSGVTVSGVAADHGFGHFGRFANGYQELFGELPSATVGTLER
jgi:AraC-like DNA-binding protein